MKNIDNKVYRLKQPFTLMKDISFKGGEEFHIVMDVVNNNNNNNNNNND